MRPPLEHASLLWLPVDGSTECHAAVSQFIFILVLSKHIALSYICTEGTVVPLVACTLVELCMSEIHCVYLADSTESTQLGNIRFLK